MSLRQLKFKPLLKKPIIKLEEPADEKEIPRVPIPDTKPIQPLLEEVTNQEILNKVVKTEEITQLYSIKTECVDKAMIKRENVKNKPSHSKENESLLVVNSEKGQSNDSAKDIPKESNVEPSISENQVGNIPTKLSGTFKRKKKAKNKNAVDTKTSSIKSVLENILRGSPGDDDSDEGSEQERRGSVEVVISDPEGNDNDKLKKDDNKVDEGLPIPQLKVRGDGSVSLNEQSLIVQHTAAKNKVGYKKLKTSNDEPYSNWPFNDTLRFYKALSSVGPDFEAMMTIFPKRSRTNLKNKFKKEERLHRHLIDKLLTTNTEDDLKEVLDELKLDKKYEQTIKTLGRNLVPKTEAKPKETSRNPFVLDNE